MASNPASATMAADAAPSNVSQAFSAASPRAQRSRTRSVMYRIVDRSLPRSSGSPGFRSGEAPPDVLASTGGGGPKDRSTSAVPVVWPSSHSGEEPAMPDDVITPDEEHDELTPVAHDDIMKRLLDYQRLLRQEGPPETQAGPSRTMVDYSAMEAQAASATAPAADEIVDLTEVEESDADVEILEVADLDIGIRLLD